MRRRGLQTPSQAAEWASAWAGASVRDSGADAEAAGDRPRRAVPRHPAPSRKWRRSERRRSTSRMRSTASRSAYRRLRGRKRRSNTELHWAGHAKAVPPDANPSHQLARGSPLTGTRTDETEVHDATQRWNWTGRTRPRRGPGYRKGSGRRPHGRIRSWRRRQLCLSEVRQDRGASTGRTVQRAEVSGLRVRHDPATLSPGRRRSA